MKGSKKRKEAGPLVIIGNGMVSWRLCQKLVEQGVHETREILVFGEEPCPAYDRVNLTKYFELENPQGLQLSPADWYAANRIELKTGTRIQKLDTAQREVVDAEGLTYPYGECVLATGSRAFVPPIEGADSKNVFVYRTIDDIEAIKAAAVNARSGLVIGGGLLGLEAANVLKDLGLNANVVQAANGLMSRQLNEDGAGYLLKEVAKLGIRVRLNAYTDKIEPIRDELNVHFRSGESISVDIVIIATGITPCDDLAVQADLPTALRGGVIVDDWLNTTDPNVYAIGECAAHNGHVYGLIAPGYAQADVLAANFAGKKVRYTGSDESCRLKLLGVEVATFGDYMEEGQYNIYRGEHSYRSLVTRKSKLIGATVVGEWAQTAELERAVREGRKLKARQIVEFERGGALFAEGAILSVVHWPDRTLVCNCTGTTCGALREAIQGGCTTVAALTGATGAGGVCGSCQPQLAELVGDTSTVLHAVKPRGVWLMWVAAVLAIAALLAIFIAPPLPVAKSVQSGYYAFTQIWQDSLTKQITGYTIAGLSLLAILLSARKRLRFLNFGNYGFWRAVHSWLGVLTIGGILFHTGLNFGENLNMWLLICFLGLNFAGGLAAIAVAAEKRIGGTVGVKLRNFATKAHIVFFMPYPVLLGFHIAKVYLY